jgi:signal transduction histidine kinase/putative methionine-R-sulfoxide reductase with GAF domain
VTDASSPVDELRLEVERLRRSSEATERRLRASHAVARVLADATSIDEAMPRILSSLGAALGATLATFWIIEDDTLAVHSSWADEPLRDAWDETCRALQLKVGDGLPGSVWKARGPVWIDDVSSALLPRNKALGLAKIKSGIGFPLTVGQEICGIVDLFTTTHEPADDHLVEVLRTIGGHVGQFIQSVTTLARLRRDAEIAQATARELAIERETLAKLFDVNQRITAELDQQALVQNVIDAATQVTGGEMGAFFYNLSETGDRFTLFAVSGVKREQFAKLPLPRNTPLLTPTFGNKVVIRIDDVTVDPRYARNPPHHGVPEGHLPLKSYLAVPVISRNGNTLGAMFFGHSDARMFTERSQRLAVTLSASAATAMDNALLFSEQQRLIRELEKTNDELDQFAYAASHDLRAPLRGISNLASWVEEDLGTSTPKKVREHIALLKGRASRMDKLINGLLELVDVTELLHETIDLLSAPESSRILIVGAMPTMTAERFALQQVFLNLIGNAIQHSGRKDVIVRITAGERVEEYEFAVSDNGVGIPPEHHERVWQIFQTLQARDVVESTGIGLTIVRKQVETHGGRAWIDPQSPGATVRFTWPKSASKR